MSTKINDEIYVFITDPMCIVLCKKDSDCYDYCKGKFQLRGKCNWHPEKSDYCCDCI